MIEIRADQDALALEIRSCRLFVYDMALGHEKQIAGLYLLLTLVYTVLRLSLAAKCHEDEVKTNHALREDGRVNLVREYQFLPHLCGLPPCFGILQVYLCDFARFCRHVIIKKIKKGEPP